MARPRGFDPEHVVEAAMDVFWVGGYAATSTQDLCHGTGLARSSLYNTYKSKRELYEQALRRYAERTRTEQAELLAQDGPVREVIRGFLLRAVDAQLADPARRGCLALNAAVEVGAADEAVADLTRTDFDAIVATMKALIERGQRTGEIAPDRDAEALARLVHAALTGIHVVGRVAEDRTRLTHIVDALIDSL
ncbi:TetR/AcrR family transcriptional regulator [Jiangella rhizosphaerae]|uniref:TetR/AcrR family transcriptional regulator n=1 Tax=Jiangella rhizosphaerae TaxID=2293569 RepID=A0A418KIT2_9ACTN|nr:TetR/AcrR family transcriptional regulator [Jiangella rhizosphaerae]RIQ13224.1 TetR/AcrR family transcriptional regulator [Jiangella rhizosphaerae]